MPLQVAPPLLLAVKVTPLGNVPLSLSAGAGKPLSVTVKLPPEPTVNVVLAVLVIADAWSTVSVKLCVASAPMPLWREGKVAVVSPLRLPVTAVPLSTPVAAVKVMPLGNVPLSLNAGAGKPLSVTVKLPAAPTVNVVLAVLVMEAA